MTAEVLPFPSARRADLVRSIVRRALTLRPAAGEDHIVRSMELQASVMRRKGVPSALIAKDVAALSAAIRANMWDAVLQPRETR